MRKLYGQLLVDEIASAVQRLTVLPGVLDLLAHMRGDAAGDARPAHRQLRRDRRAEAACSRDRARLVSKSLRGATWPSCGHALVQVALAQLATAIAPEDVIVVGDTVRDVHCARDNGSVCVAVATGGSSAEELRAAGAHVVLDDLRDPGPLLRLLG